MFAIKTNFNYILSNCDFLEKPPNKYATSRQLLKKYNY